MDIKSLAKLSSGDDKSMNIEDSHYENPVTKKLSRVRINDSVSPIPKNSTERLKWANRIIDSVISFASEDEIEPLKSRLLKMIEAYEVRSKRINDTANKLKSELLEVQNKLNSKNLELRRISDSNKKTESLEKRILDSEYILADKEEEIRKLEEEKKRLEEENKLNEEEKKRLEEEKRKLESQGTVTDSYSSSDVKEYASLLEELLSEGKVENEDKLRELGNRIEEKELTNKIVNYESVDASQYDEITKSLKDKLKEAGVKIPSLPLIMDSAVVEGLDKYKQYCIAVPISDIVLAIQNFITEPNDETESKVVDLAASLEDGELKTIINSLIESVFAGNYDINKLAKELLKIKANANVDVDIFLPNVEEIPLQVPTTDQIFETPMEPVLTHQDYQILSDSAGRLARAKNIVVRIKDCMGVSVDTPTTYVDVLPFVQSITPVEGTDYMQISYDGISHLYAWRDSENQVENLARIGSAQSPELMWEYINQYLVPMVEVTEVLEENGDLDLLTDSVLYKRKLSNKYWITDSMKAEDFIQALPKLKRLIRNHKVYNQIKDSCVTSKVRLIVSSSSIDVSGKEFRSMRVKDSIDFSNSRYNFRLFLESK